jgi:predicted peroxiredoxin
MLACRAHPEDEALAEESVPGDNTMKVLIKSAWGSADPTQAAFPFHHANAFAEAGHEVQIFLLGEAVSLMRAVVAASVIPVGWAPLSDALAEVADHGVPIHV